MLYYKYYVVIIKETDSNVNFEYRIMKPPDGGVH